MSNMVVISIVKPLVAVADQLTSKFSFFEEEEPVVQEHSDILQLKISFLSFVVQHSRYLLSLL